MSKWMVAVVLAAVLGAGLRADDDGKAKSVELPVDVKNAWALRYAGATVLETKSKDGVFEIKGRDELNKDFKAEYGADGKLVRESKRKIELVRMPQQVHTTAMTWAPGARWIGPAEVETKRGEATVYELKAEIGEKTYKILIKEDGTQVKADSLPSDAPKTPPGPRIDHERRVLRCC